MGLFDLFKGKRDDEDALSAMRAGSDSSLASPDQVMAAGGLGEHGIDAHAAAGGGQIDISDNAELQKQILGVLEQFGIDPTPADPGD